MPKAQSVARSKQTEECEEGLRKDAGVGAGAGAQGPDACSGCVKPADKAGQASARALVVDVEGGVTKLRRRRRTKRKAEERRM